MSAHGMKGTKFRGLSSNLERPGVLAWLCGWGQRPSGWTPSAGGSRKQDLKAGQADFPSVFPSSRDQRPLHTGVLWAAFQALPRTGPRSWVLRGLHTYHRDLGQASLPRSHPPGHCPLGLVFLISRQQESKAWGPVPISFSLQRLALAPSLFLPFSSPFSVPLFPVRCAAPGGSQGSDADTDGVLFVLEETLSDNWKYQICLHWST